MYTPDYFLNKALDQFNNTDLRAWLLHLGIPTLVGSSGRVFPEKGIKPIEVLNCIETYLKNKSVHFKFNKTFTGWTEEGYLEFNSEEVISSDYTIFAFGGSSWKITGSDGSWLSLFEKQKIDTTTFKPSNCAYHVHWEKRFIEKHEGKPLKNSSITFNNQTQKGEVVITKFGIEGNAIYGLSPQIQAALSNQQEVEVFLDFKSMFTSEQLIEKISHSKTNLSKALKEKIKLSAAEIDLIKTTLTKDQFLHLPTLVHYIKNFPLKILAAAPIDEAISTSGGICLNEVDDHFEFIKMKNNFCIGEMLDWDAPTGGYLIQACASSGAYLAHYLNHKSTSSPTPT